MHIRKAKNQSTMGRTFAIYVTNIDSNPGNSYGALSPLGVFPDLNQEYALSTTMYSPPKKTQIIYICLYIHIYV